MRPATTPRADLAGLPRRPRPHRRDAAATARRDALGATGLRIELAEVARRGLGRAHRRRTSRASPSGTHHRSAAVGRRASCRRHVGDRLALHGLRHRPSPDDPAVPAGSCRRSSSPGAAPSIWARDPACWRWPHGAWAPRDIEALDDDEDAIVNARENLRLNGAESAITLRHADVRRRPSRPRRCGHRQPHRRAARQSGPVAHRACAARRHAHRERLSRVRSGRHPRDVHAGVDTG